MKLLKRMRLKRLTDSLILAVLFLSMVSGIAYGFLYRAPVTITENASTSYDMLPVTWNQNNTWLAANGFMASTANDTRVQTLGGSNKPWMVADNKTLTAVPVPADSQTNLFFTTGESAASSMDIIFGYGGYVSTNDTAALEWGANGGFTGYAYLDTTQVGANVTGKDGAMRVYYPAAGNVTATVFGTAGLSETLAPAGAGDLTDIPTVVGAATHWQSQLTNDADTSYIDSTLMGNYDDTYTIAANSIPSSAVIDSVVVHFVHKHDTTAAYSKAYPIVRLGGVSVVGTGIGGFGAYVDDSESLARPGGGTWTKSDIDSLQIGVRLWNTDSGVRYARSTQVYVVVNYHIPDATASVASVAPGYQFISANITGGNLVLTVGSSTDTDTSPNLTDNGNPWVWGRGNAVAYWGYIKMTVGGVEVIHYQPNTIVNGVILPDRAGTAHNGDITWGSNPAGVGATLGSFTSAGQPSVGATSDTSTRNILPVVGGTDWRPAAGVSATLQANPMRPIVTAISDNTTLSEYQVWVWFGIIFVVFILILVGSRVRGHHLITGIAVTAALILLVVWTVFPWGVLFIAALAIVFGLVSERSPSL